ncbi:PP2C family protein-serine/threonine phosphatase [Enterobacter roggenkampii]|uniref:PP2C family protein-serine/threonine phosphatase n=1 Tax=Enterobacter roggenkampii TaxID=1812935 RepID=UPI000931A1FE|nr:protein phosphatase 2C domain-containing protein [Enterobacter roggenkampii]MCM7841083.1 protein phosphatase 2C domain-containing protein [Enterobacter roggenkampii]
MTNIYSCASFSLPKSTEGLSQDSILLPQRLDGGYLLSVADGVGGYKGGMEASNAAVRVLSSINSKVKESDVGDIFNSVKESITQLSVTNKDLSSAATTLTFCYVNNSGLLIGHSGDCRLYLKNGSKLKLYTKDHTQHQILIDKGLFTAGQLRKLSGGNVLTTAVSAKIKLDYQTIFIDRNDLPLENGVLTMYIMSDGAHHFWEERPRFSLNTLSNPNRFASSLLKRIQKRGPHDDYSLIGVSIKM